MRHFYSPTKQKSEISSKEDSLTLKSEIDELESWPNKWLLKFNIDKYHVLTLSKLENIKHTRRYSICQNELEHVFDEKYLGVIFDSDLKFEVHVSMKVNKANVIGGLIRRNFSFLDCKLFKKLYVAFVRPHLEYTQSVWTPHLKKHIDMLDNVKSSSN